MSDIVDSLSDYIRAGFDPHNQLKEARGEIERLNAEIARLRADAVALQSVMERMREWESLVLRDRATVTAENAQLREALEKMQRSRDRYREAWETEKARAALAEQGEK